ncbi:MAG: hypothetical protein KGQ70_08090, partial [Alphaproteobacteria bacterium]|nr:hypothetical protein [Alphaproteobacteria bacterium]
LQTGHENSLFRPIAPAGQKTDYSLVPVAGVVRPVNVSADGQLTIGIVDGPNPAPWPRAWSGLMLNDRQEYMACATVPSILPPPLVRAMKHIDRVAAACHAAGMTSACAHLLFDIADENHDGKISRQEMKSAAAMLGGMALLVKNSAVSRAALGSEERADEREAGRLARRFMPDGGGMTYADFSGFAARAQSGRLDSALAGIGALIHGFRP